MLNSSPLWEGEEGRGLLLLPTLSKRTAGHLVFQAYDDFADVLLLLSPAGSRLWKGTGCLPLSRQWVIPVISLCFQLLHHLFQHPTAELFPWGKVSWTPRAPARPLFSLQHRTGCTAPALACCDRQQFILKYGVTGDIVCPGALTVSLS